MAMGDEAAADWQDGMVEWGQEEAEEWHAKQRFQAQQKQPRNIKRKKPPRFTPSPFIRESK